MGTSSDYGSYERQSYFRPTTWLLLCVLIAELLIVWGGR